MLISQKKSSPTKFRKPLIIGVFVIILVITGLTTYVYAFGGNIFGWSITKSNNKPSVDTDSVTNEQKKAGDKIKEDSVNQSLTNQKPNTGGTDQPQSPSPIPGSNKKGVDVAITAATQNGSTLQIRSLIYLVTSTGTCTLTLSKSGSVSIVKTADVMALSSSTTCRGFNVPVSEFPIGGAWNATLRFDSDTFTGNTTKSVNIIK